MDNTDFPKDTPKLNFADLVPPPMNHATSAQL